jgi:hypothetical protein
MKTESDPTNKDGGKDEEGAEEMDSSDEALLEMLGLSSLDHVGNEEEEDKSTNKNDATTSTSTSKLPLLSDQSLSSPLMESIGERYKQESLCIFPREFSVSAEHLRRLTEALVWGGPNVQADRTYETIKRRIVSTKNGGGGGDDGGSSSQIIEHRRTLTRLENFVDAHEGWSELCHGYLRRLLSAALQTEMVLYKEKLNLKPPGGSGFAPHLDSPSLRVALGKEGPQTFCTVMVAIDDMHSRNGCLRICKGRRRPWSETNCAMVVQPQENGNPDAGGRAGAIPTEEVDRLEFEDLECAGGTVLAFNGWAPHRSGANTSPFPRRAVFLTYNPKSEGDFHERYYERMEQLRNGWKSSVGLADRQQRMENEKMELDALTTIPKI